MNANSLNQVSSWGLENKHTREHRAEAFQPGGLGKALTLKHPFLGGAKEHIHPNRLWLSAKNTDHWVPSQIPESDPLVMKPQNLFLFYFVLDKHPETLMQGVRGGLHLVALKFDYHYSK